MAGRRLYKAGQLMLSKTVSLPLVQWRPDHNSRGQVVEDEATRRIQNAATIRPLHCENRLGRSGDNDHNNVQRTCFRFAWSDGQAILKWLVLLASSQ